MSIQSPQEFENTQKKLGVLEQRLAALKQETGDNTKVREWTMRSLGKMIKQMKEEIIRYQLAAKAHAHDS